MKKFKMGDSVVISIKGVYTLGEYVGNTSPPLRRKDGVKLHLVAVGTVAYDMPLSRIWRPEKIFGLKNKI